MYSEIFFKKWHDLIYTDFSNKKMLILKKILKKIFLSKIFATIIKFFHQNSSFFLPKWN